ncbi:MAG: hypothetical protein IPL46_28045 [Saprospiraceae bacterium]|nr:hypothetical protein [Saprospiraceae bacterium]
MYHGIKIYTELNPKDCVTISQGTENVSILNGLPAQNPTFVPKRPWNKPGADQLKIIMGTVNEPPAYQSIGLYLLPQSLVNQWKQLGIHQAESELEINQIMKEADYPKVIGATEEWAKKFQLRKEPMITHRLACISKGLRTVTFTPPENRYLGLHLDSWEKKSLDELKSVRNRLCINLGRSPRYFLYMNLEIKQLQSILDLTNQSNARVLIQTFLERFPEYPVIRVKLNPFEAYIAPTENLIHDGSSEDQHYQDVQLTLRSYFAVQTVKRGLFQSIKGIFATQ